MLTCLRCAAAERLEDDLHGEPAGDTVVVVWRRNLNDIHGAEPDLGKLAHEGDRLARGQAAGSRHASSGSIRAVNRINVESEVDAICPITSDGRCLATDRDRSLLDDGLDRQ